MWKTQKIKLLGENERISSWPWGMGNYLKQNTKSIKNKGKD